MARRFVASLADGDSVEDVYLVAEKQLRVNRNGASFIQMDLQDRTGTIATRVWNVGEQQFRNFESGDFLLIKGKVQLFQGSLQMIASTFEKYDPAKVNRTDFMPHTEQDVNKLLEKLRGYLLKLGNHHLKALAQSYLMDDQFMNGFTKAPAGVKVHHAYVGGLLEHVVAMMEVADRILPLYPAVDRDLLLIGIFLHDTGKVRELAYESNFSYTDEGQLIGHLPIGIEMLMDRIEGVESLTEEKFPRELLLRLKHMILSHHGTLEFGSPKVPMTPEAVALHAIDTLDTRIHITVREIKDDRTPSRWTPYNNAMQRRLFKGGPGQDGAEQVEED
jgi:3'-5' exoribonuclease